MPATDRFVVAASCYQGVVTVAIAVVTRDDMETASARDLEAVAMTGKTEEHRRLEEARTGSVPWKAWGPYLSERQWGTVREDYSENGDAWNYFTHEQARSRAYRWGEDGIAGICDERQRMCLALALWNGRDPILKERMFGLNNGEGNHGEDVKEYWFYLDSTPTHSYLKCQYKYPQRAFPYLDLVSTNSQRSREDLEYELLDTGIFDEDRYFDVIVEYAKADHDDILMLVTAHNRGPDPATLHLLPTLWFRNTWSWGDEVPKPTLAAVDDAGGLTSAVASHAELGTWRLSVDASANLLFCENETNNQRLFGAPNASTYAKDGINDFVVDGAVGAVNPERTGTKLAAHHVLEVAPGTSASIRLRLTAGAKGATEPRSRKPLGDDFERVMQTRRSEADVFYETVIPAALDDDRALVMRQALAGMLWGKQYFEYDVHQWLREHGIDPWDPDAPASSMRNVPWFHMVAADIISMPDKWEYPWFAAWDLAFHTAPLSLVDVDFAKEQVELLLSTRYLHPNGQIPAYEWNFSDVNPPVTPWAALFVYEREAEIRGEGDREFLARVFNRLLGELHLVGQSQGSGRPEPVPGRIPRPRQHRHLRSVGSAARGRDARAGGRHRLDGALLPVDAADLGRACQARPGVSRHGHEVHRAFRVDRRCDESPAWRHGTLG